MFSLLTLYLAPVMPPGWRVATRGLRPRFAPLTWKDAGAPLPAGHRINEYKHLMTRVDPKQLDALFDLPAAAPAAATPIGARQGRSREERPPEPPPPPPPPRLPPPRPKARFRSTTSPRSTCAWR